MFAGQYVDERLLESGIYITNIPNLRSSETTLQDIIKSYEYLGIIKGGRSTLEKTIVDNINSCTLVDVEPITII